MSNEHKQQLTKPFIEHLRERLKTAEDFQGYLDACHEAGPDTFGLAVQDVVEIVRQEARAAVFNEAIQIAKKEAFERRLAHTVYERLVEAATTKQPEEKEG